MSGLVALVGGNEHTPGCEAADRRLLRIGGLRRPEVAVILGASPRRRQAFKRAEAEAWWSSLGARARCAFAGEPDPDERVAALLAHADLVVLTGGRPWLLRRRLTETALGGLLEERWRAGVPVAGSSAGAMLLGAASWSLRPAAPLAPFPGLAFVPGVLVVPHAGRHGTDTWAALTQAAHPELDVVGIPDRTALHVRSDGDALVVGSAPVRRYERSFPYGTDEDDPAATSGVPVQGSCAIRRIARTRHRVTASAPTVGGECVVHQS